MANPPGILPGLNLRNNSWTSVNSSVPSGGCTGGEFVVIGESVGMYFETRVAEDVGKQVSILTYAEKVIVPAASALTFAVGDIVYMDDADLTVKAAPVTGGYVIGICTRAKINGDTYVEIEFTGGGVTA